MVSGGKNEFKLSTFNKIEKTDGEGEKSQVG